MSAPEHAVTSLSLRSAFTATLSGTTRLYRLPIYCACSLLAVVVTFLLGKDLPWDALNYHLYAGFSALHNRFSQDYFAAGPESYFIPYAYVPFYALVRAGLSSLQIATIAALAQSAILWLTYELALSCCTTAPPRVRVALGLCAVAWALANPILIGEFGSSFADITTAELILAGWLLMIRAVSAPRIAFVVWAGLIIGAATALKLTNAASALSAFVLLLFMPLAWRSRLRFGVGYGAGLGVGFTIVAAPWCHRLEQQFGNPLFPLFNGWFRSPEFITGRLVSYRFIPSSFAAALWRPFELVKPIFNIQEEIRAPDMRYAVLVLLLAALAVYRVVCHWGRAAGRTDPGVARSSVQKNRFDTRVIAGLGCALGVDWAAWLTASGNGRYFLSMACVTAVVTMALLFKMFSAKPKLLGYLLAAIFAVQGTQLVLGAEYRWNPTPWDDHWVNVVVPPALATQPNLYFTMAFQSDAFLAAYLPSGSGFIDIAGQYPPDPMGAGGARVAALVRRYSPHLRMLIGGNRLYQDDEHGWPRRSAVDALLAPYGLGVDGSECQTIVLRDLQKDPELRYTGTRQAPPVEKGTQLLSCRVVSGRMSMAQLHQQRDADLVLDRLEQACPKLFQPRGVGTQFFGRGWMRYYLNTDEIAWVSRGWVKFDDPITGDGVAFLGQEADWLKGPQNVVCGRRNGHYYARLMQQQSVRSATRP